MQAGAEKLGVIEASYASAIIGVLSPVSSHLSYYAPSQAIPAENPIRSPPLAAARPLYSLVAGGAQRQWLQACLPKANHRFPLASFSAFLATARRAPHRARSLRGGSGSVGPSRLRQPPRPAIPRYLRDPHIRIERSRCVKDLARRPFTSAAREPASLSELVKSVPTLILRQDRLPLESGSGISFPT